MSASATSSRGEHLTLGEALDRRLPHPGRAEHGRVRRHDDGAEPETLGDRAGVLAARPPECDQGMVRGVEPLLDRDLPDRGGHALVRDLEQPAEHRISVRLRSWFRP